MPMALIKDYSTMLMVLVLTSSMWLLMLGANVIDDQKGFFDKIVKISQLLIHVELGNP